MLFNSWPFVVFFSLVYAAYWLLRGQYKVQNTLLLAASLLFYGWWDVRFLYLFLLTTIVDFHCALMIERGGVPARQRLIESMILIGAAFFCATVHWDAFQITWGGLLPTLQTDWATALPAQLKDWWLLLATMGAVCMVNVADPWLRTFDPVRRRKVFLWVSLISNLTVLGFFKYYNFFASSLAEAIHGLTGITPSAWTLEVVLPIGISFYTFQSLAYTIDVYRREVEPLEKYLTLATCLSFFPLLVAGPIERPRRFFPQFLAPRTINREQSRLGIWLIFWGLFKKMVVADNMAVIVNSVFSPYDGAAPSTQVPDDGLRLLIGLYAFAFQIYGDFSGYSDIARGTAKLLGFNVSLNFNLPYFAISPSDFWKRWHISLSTWLRDYLYIPLGGNRAGTLATYRNLSLTMLLGGLWHGASWTFVLWGAYHGLLLIGQRIVASAAGYRDNLQGPVAIATAPVVAVSSTQTKESHIAELSGSTGASVTMYSMGIPVPFAQANVEFRRRLGVVLKYGFLGLLMFHLTCLGWLLFRAQSVTAITVFLRSILLHPNWSPEATMLAKEVLFYSWFLVVFQIVQGLMATLDPMRRCSWFIRLNMWIIVIVSLLALSSKTQQAFIYFAF